MSWISVEDRLPEVAGEYLVSMRYSDEPEDPDTNYHWYDGSGNWGWENFPEFTLAGYGILVYAWQPRPKPAPLPDPPDLAGAA